MTRFVAFLALLIARQEAKMTPSQKVIQLLNGMAEKGKKEKHEKQAQFAVYEQFCDDNTVEKQHPIKEANEMMEMLQVDIEKYKTEADRLTKENAKHDEDISTWEDDFNATTKMPRLPFHSWP